MKRYLVFAYECYYPNGGWNDFKGSYDTLEEAKVAAKLCKREYNQIVDGETEEELY